ncbi:MAG: Mov34/MPN/PAD-1 family protein [Candidatus Rokubacteria bacterium]|nr:Mov34/MPN/PAD-1 family protein [Candidatus Rokubacteria bacterium]
MSRVILTGEEIARVQEQAIAEYPAECCGVVLVRLSLPEERLLLPCRNIQNELNTKDPARYPRDARTAYYIDPRDLLTIGRREAEGYRVATIYHSHIDTGAYFSDTDKRNALINGEPTYPEAVYVVLSIIERRLAGASAFTWEPARRDFVPTALTLPVTAR